MEKFLSIKQLRELLNVGKRTMVRAKDRVPCDATRYGNLAGSRSQMLKNGWINPRSSRLSTQFNENLIM